MCDSPPVYAAHMNSMIRTMKRSRYGLSMITIGKGRAQKDNHVVDRLEQQAGRRHAGNLLVKGSNVRTAWAKYICGKTCAQGEKLELQPFSWLNGMTESPEGNELDWQTSQIRRKPAGLHIDRVTLLPTLQLLLASSKSSHSPGRWDKIAASQNGLRQTNSFLQPGESCVKLPDEAPQ